MWSAECKRLLFYAQLICTNYSCRRFEISITWYLHFIYANTCIYYTLFTPLFTQILHHFLSRIYRTMPTCTHATAIKEQRYSPHVWRVLKAIAFVLPSATRRDRTIHRYHKCVEAKPFDYFQYNTISLSCWSPKNLVKIHAIDGGSMDFVDSGGGRKTHAENGAEFGTGWNGNDW